MKTSRLCRPARNRVHANLATGLRSQVSHHQQQPCSSLLGVSSSVRRFNKLGGRQPPTAVAGRGACQVRGGAGPCAKHGGSAQPTHTKDWPEIPYCPIFHVHNLSKRFNILCGKRFGRSGEKLGAATNFGGIFLKTSPLCRPAGNRAHANLAIGLSSQVSRQQQQPCSSLIGVSFSTYAIWTNLAAGNPQLQWLGGALVRRGEGRGPAPNTGCPADARKQGRCGAEYASLVFGGRLGRNPVWHSC